MYIECHRLHVLYDFDFEIYSEEWYDFTEKNCGKIPEGADRKKYHRDRYSEYTNSNYDWEAALYFSDEKFDPESYNDKSIKRESKIAFKKTDYFDTQI